MTRHQYGISALVSQTSFRWQTSGSVAKCRLFSQVTTGVDPGSQEGVVNEQRKCLLYRNYHKIK